MNVFRCTYLWVSFLLLFGCAREVNPPLALQVTDLYIGSRQLSLSESVHQNIPLDQPIDIVFNQPVAPNSTDAGILWLGPKGAVPADKTFFRDNQNIRLAPRGLLEEGQTYTLELNTPLSAASGANFSPPQTFVFQTLTRPFQLLAADISGQPADGFIRTLEVPLAPKIRLTFSTAVRLEAIRPLLQVKGKQIPSMQFSLQDGDRVLEIEFSAPLQPLSKYELTMAAGNYGAAGQPGPGFTREFFTALSETNAFPLLSDADLLTLVQQQTFRYFWDYGHPVSGMARERASQQQPVTTGGSGFGIMAMIVAVERGFITRSEARQRWKTMLDFLSTADRFHGVWPHWMDGASGKVVPFSARDNGGDLVETAFMVQGLITLRQYLDPTDAEEKSMIDRINQLWQEVEWSWYTKGGEKQLYWHWSPDQNFAINLRIRGHNETQIVYVLAAASPTFPIDAATYRNGYADQGNMVRNRNHYGLPLPLGNQPLGGPLFFTHYSYLGLDPRNLKDEFADYWQQNVNHSLIQNLYCADNPKKFAGYSDQCWGLTASYSPGGYSAHHPGNDLGVIAPTAAISSIPFTPEASMNAIRHFYYRLGDRLWGPYGFYDAFSPTAEWVSRDYLAIDQGPQICMIENYRTQLLWNLFMSAPEIRAGLEKLNMSYE